MLGHGGVVGLGQVLGLSGLTGLCCGINISLLMPSSTPASRIVSTYLPSDKTQVHLSTALSSDSLVLLEAAANSTGSNGQVAVVTVDRKSLVSS